MDVYSCQNSLNLCTLSGCIFMIYMVCTPYIDELTKKKKKKNPDQVLSAASQPL